ncbi:hypothetical protein [Vibrio sp. D431a]|uniref:hypothetical protein n=1 Tax=Vibrio sp. D431a TaxID=2837388 RepID=UPI002554DF3F|nr:hypothetical protein [Vibrio sp. D431a]MDK9790133.1 hypothetical protein [Vibrio sp. D431a]
MPVLRQDLVEIFTPKGNKTSSQVNKLVEMAKLHPVITLCAINHDMISKYHPESANLCLMFAIGKAPAPKFSKEHLLELKALLKSILLTQNK